MTDSENVTRVPIDIDHFHDRKPNSFTRVRYHRARPGTASMNSFDVVVCAATIAAVIMGFNAGLLRSAVTILAYVIAMPIAVWVTSQVTRDAGSLGLMQNPLPFFGTFLIAGIVLGKLMRMAIDEAIGTESGIADRLAGSALGAVRVGLVAISVVVVFDQLIPPDRQPPYLAGSRLRPLFSAAGQMGLKSMPPDIASYVDRLKRDRRI
jgi:membrane protein required for colicin V production